MGRFKSPKTNSRRDKKEPMYRLFFIVGPRPRGEHWRMPLRGVGPLALRRSPQTGHPHNEVMSRVLDITMSST